jgi:hypothetical protein
MLLALLGALRVQCDVAVRRLTQASVVDTDLGKVKGGLRIKTAHLDNNRSAGNGDTLSASRPPSISDSISRVALCCTTVTWSPFPVPSLKDFFRLYSTKAFDCRCQC